MIPLRHANEAIPRATMKQSTLKRPASARNGSSRKRIQTLPGAGTASEPLELDTEEGPIDVDAIESDKATPESIPDVNNVKPSTKSDVRQKLPMSGPTTSDPLKINEPDFDIQSVFTNVEPKVILKDPDLDLLYFKRMSKVGWLSLTCT